MPRLYIVEQQSQENFLSIVAKQGGFPAEIRGNNAPIAHYILRYKISKGSGDDK
jgi:hypothetical protein